MKLTKSLTINPFFISLTHFAPLIILFRYISLNNSESIFLVHTQHRFTFGLVKRKKPSKSRGMQQPQNISIYVNL